MVRPVAQLTRILERTVGQVQRRFTSPLHSARVASVLGVALGVSFTVCFASGLITWWIQHPPTWFDWPSRPAGLYRMVQGAHVGFGIASIPLLLAKLWTVYPKFWTWPPARSIAVAVERVSVLPLVGGSLFLLFSGTANIALWYPWTFSFPSAHLWAAWVTMGALVAHVGAKIHIVRRELRGRPDATVASDGLGRRQFLGAAFGASALLTVVTIGQTFRPLSRIGLLAPRRPSIGPQGLPVNKTAAGVRVLDRIDPASYRLTVVDGVNRRAFDLDALRNLHQTAAVLPIACVEGWSAEARWAGPSVASVLAAAGVAIASVAEIRVESLQIGGSYRSSILSRTHAADRHTMLALTLDGDPLHPDHGFPLRLIGPNRPGVLQTKWVHELVVRR